jgi:hypothetical protein
MDKLSREFFLFDKCGGTLKILDDDLSDGHNCEDK